MILELFVVLAAIAFGCVVLGHFTSDRIYVLVGLTLIFLLGVVLISGSLQIQTGVIVTPNGSSLNVENQYAYFVDTNSHWFGWLLSAISISGIALLFLGNFGQEKRRQE